jgi:hypothetical protein
LRTIEFKLTDNIILLLKGATALKNTAAPFLFVKNIISHNNLQRELIHCSLDTTTL